MQNWIEIESVDFPNRLYPHRWTMKIHFYFISLSWNMFYNIFIRTREIKKYPISLSTLVLLRVLKGIEDDGLGEKATEWEKIQ